jgi:hypothetical protein
LGIFQISFPIIKFFLKKVSECSEILSNYPQKELKFKDNILVNWSMFFGWAEQFRFQK